MQIESVRTEQTSAGARIIILVNGPGPIQTEYAEQNIGIRDRVGLVDHAALNLLFIAGPEPDDELGPWTDNDEHDWGTHE